MSDSQVRLQKLRGFTLQIRRPSDEAIFGTGIAISMDGQIVTCAHVVEAILKVHPREVKDEEISVYFPEFHGRKGETRRAKIARCFQQHDDDVVVLQLCDGMAPLAPEQIPVLGTAEDSCLNPFQSYGYRSLDKYIAGIAYGTILGCVERPLNEKLQGDPVQLESNQINRGMSGAAVLDVERNLVVGIVSETWFPDSSMKDQNTAWAVNARMLSLEPLGLTMQDAPLPKGNAPQPKTDIEEAKQAVAPDLGIVWNNAPLVLAEWIGRQEFLESLTADWQNPNCRVVGLIGFGGEGKSSLARKWVENLLHPPDSSPGRGQGWVPPDGVFWWGFYTKPNVEEFFEEVLKYLSGGRIDPRALPSANLKAQVLGAMLGTGRYLFVLDGLEILQHQEGDQYGLLQSKDLQEFLSYFTDPQRQQSFCLITSRAPVLDLMDYTSYTHRDVTRLSTGDGCDLLRKVGVQGTDAVLEQIVKEWDGHALTLSLLGAYLVDQHGGKASQIYEIPPPTEDEPRYERVHRVLRRYDEHLTEAERTFLTLFSAFRTPVEESVFEKVFRKKEKPERFSKPFRFELNTPIAALSDKEFETMLRRLLTYRIVHHDPRAQQYSTHPLIRAHYFAKLTAGDRTQTQKTHETIKDYYLELAGDTPRNPTLDDLLSLIEVVFHACRTGAYDEAYNVWRERIDQRNRGVLVYQLGAYETDLALIHSFFPDGDISQEPQVSDPKYKSYILNEVGLCLMCLGRLSQAVPFYERAVEMYLEMQNWSFASVGYNNLAYLHAALGVLAASAEAARETLTLARRAENKEDERNSLARKAWVVHLQGDLETAGTAFKQAEVLGQEIEPDKLYRYSIDGIWYADHLRRIGDADYARRITEANIKICENER